MKKFLIFVLLCIPMTAFAASSVRVLGGKSATPGTTVPTSTASAKVLPAKSAAVKTTSAASPRIGTVRAKAKTVAPTTVGGSVTSTTSTNSGSRFPVITPAHSYNSVTKPSAASSGNTTNVNVNNYYTKDEVDEKLDDPRFDMIRISNGNPESNWTDNPLLQQRLNERYVFMWIEE